MKLSMFNFRATLSAAVLVVAGLTATHAQAQERAVRVNVPFAFEEGSSHMKPGVYTIGLQDGNLLSIRGSSNSSFAMVQPEESARPAETGKVVFHRYGNRYFLRQIWIAGDNVHLDCHKSRAEKELQIASNEPGSPDGTEVALVEMPH